MKVFLSLTLLLFVSNVFAKGIQAEWKCPENGQAKSVNVFFDDQGRLKLNPNVVEQKYKDVSSFDVGICLINFQRKVKEAVTAFKASQCPASKDDICYASQGYVDAKVWERLNTSSLAKKNSISLSVPTPETVPGTTASGSTGTTPSTTTTTVPTQPEVKRVPQTPEEFLEAKIASKEIDPKNLSHEFIFGGKRYKVGEFDKVVGDNMKNVLMDLSTADSRQYAQNYMMMNYQILNNEAQSPKRTAVLNNLNKMFGYIYGEKGAEELAKMLECKPEDDLTPIQEILENLDDSKKMAKCDQLKNGEHKVFGKEHSDYYGTGNYLLRRDPNGTYKITLNVDFKTGSGSVTPAEMMQRSKACLALASEAMTGPNGEKMTIEVLTPSEIQNLPADMRPKENKVTIENVNYGTNAGGYAEDEKCPVITHEMFHLLGLCDEYKEDRPEYEHLAWKCRVVTKVPSIMRDTRAFDQAVGSAQGCDCSTSTCKTIMDGSNEDLKNLYLNKSVYDISDYKFRSTYCKETSLPEGKIATLPNLGKTIVVNQTQSIGTKLEVENRFVTNISAAPYYRILRSKITCTCPAGDADCEKQKNEILTKASNVGVKDACPMGALWKKGAERGTLPRGAHYKDGMLTMISNPTIPSLLQPNHFHKILEGNCPGGKSAAYQECADFAYKKPPCDVPAKCQEDSYYLGSQQ